MDAVTADGAEVLVVAPRHLRVGGVTVHQTRTLIAADVVRRPPFRLTTPVRTLIDLAGAVDQIAREGAFEDAIRRNLVRVNQLQGACRSVGDEASEASGRSSA